MHETCMTTDSAPPVALGTFLDRMGVAPITGWRWRKKGWLKTINIGGRQYVTAEDAAEFSRRAAAGEFAQEHKVPTKEVAA